MKYILIFAVTAILTLSATTFADVKIKTKQTMSGQTTENTTYIKGKRTRTEMMGGVMVTITQCDLGRDLQLNPSMKTYLTNLYYDGTPVPQTEPTTQQGKSTEITKGGTMFVTTTIKDTGERRSMFGFTARHIITTIETETSEHACLPVKNKMEMDAWVIDLEFGQTCTQAQQYRPKYDGKSAGCQDKVVPKTIGSAKSGYPVWQKMTTFDAIGKESFSMIQEVVELSKTTLDRSLFEAPADYREVKDTTEMYAAVAPSGLSIKAGSDNAVASPSPASGLGSGIRDARNSKADISTPASMKKPGTIRVGVAVKTASVGEGITASDLSAAIQNTLGSFLKGTKVEVIPLEARLAAAQAGEAREKECDYILLATAAHKKGGGGGGFGFGKMLGQVVSQTGIGHTGSAVGNIAGQIGTTAIVTASNVSSSVKNKDEMTLDLRLSSVADDSSALAKQFKAKAKSDGDDIISTIVEQAAQAILDTIGN